MINAEEVRKIKFEPPKIPDLLVQEFFDKAEKLIIQSAKANLHKAIVSFSIAKTERLENYDLFIIALKESILKVLEEAGYTATYKRLSFRYDTYYCDVIIKW